MASLDEIKRALINADKAGDFEAAKILTAEIDRQMAAQQPQQSTVGGLVDAVTQGATFGFGDEITGVEAGLLGRTPEGGWFDYSQSFGDRYAAARDAERAQQEQFRAQNPVKGAVAELGGAIATGAGAAGAGATLANSARSTTGALGLGALEGGLYGGLYGAGNATEGNRLAGAGIGGLTGAVIGGPLNALGHGFQQWLANRAFKKAAPSMEQLQGMKNAAYGAVDDSGAVYSQNAYDDLVSAVQQSAKADRIHPMRHPKASSMIDDLADMSGQTQSLTELDQLRQVVRRDVANATDPAEAHFGRLIIDNIDDFVDNAGPGQMIGGNADEAASLIANARDLNSRFRKVQTLEDMMKSASRQAGSTGSGGNINNKMLQKLRGVLDNPKKARMFTQAELDMMDAIIASNNSGMQSVARRVGKLSPTGNGLMTALGIGGAAANPMLAGVPAVGALAKHAADKGTAGKLELLKAMMAGGDDFVNLASQTQSQAAQRAMLARVLSGLGGGGASNQILEVNVP